MAERILKRQGIMRILTRITLFDVLHDWGLHEALGRLPAMGKIDPALVESLRQGSDGWEIVAADICLQVRRPVVVQVLAGDPIQYVRIEVTEEDIDHLFAMAAGDEAPRRLRIDASDRATGTDDANTTCGPGSR